MARGRKRLCTTAIGPPGQSYGEHYDFMQMRYSFQLLTIYSCALISEGGFCRCVVLSNEGSMGHKFYLPSDSYLTANWSTLELTELTSWKADGREERQAIAQ